MRRKRARAETELSHLSLLLAYDYFARSMIFLFSLSRLKGLSSLIYVVFCLRSSSKVHCDLRLKYRGFSHFVAELSGSDVYISSFLPFLVPVVAVPYIWRPSCPGDRGYHNLTSRARAIVSSEDFLLSYHWNRL